MKFGLEPVTDDNVGIISPRAMRAADPSNANPKINAFLITFCEVAAILGKAGLSVNPNLAPNSTGAAGRFPGSINGGGGLFVLNIADDEAGG